MALNQCVSPSFHQTRQFTNITAAPVSATVSVFNLHSALMHTKLLFPDKRSRFNERWTDANLHAFVAIIADISFSHGKNQILLILYLFVQQKIYISLCVRTNKKYFPEKRHCTN